MLVCPAREGGRLSFPHFTLAKLTIQVWGGPVSADGVEFMISSSFTLDLDPFFTAMQSAADAAEGLR